MSTKELAPISTSINVGLAMAIQLARKRFETDSCEHPVPYLVSVPGAGKTQLLSYLCNKLGYGSESYTLALKPLEWLTGLPTVIPQQGDDEEARVKWLRPEFIDELYALSKKHEFSIVLLDDFHYCTSSQQAYGYEIFTYHKLHGIQLPKNVRFVVAGNNSSLSGAKQIMSAILNRMLPITVKPDREYWLENFAYPNKLNPIVTAFLKNNVHEQFFAEEESSTPYGSPRSWSALAHSIDAISETINLSENLSLFHAMALGSLSKTAANEFYLFYSIYSKVPVDQIYSTGEWKMPSESEKYAFITAITDYIISSIIHFAEKTHFKASEHKEEFTSFQKKLKVYNGIINKFHKGDVEMASLSANSILTNKYEYNHNGKVVPMWNIVKDLMTNNLLSSETLTSLMAVKNRKFEEVNNLSNKMLKLSSGV